MAAATSPMPPKRQDWPALVSTSARRSAIMTTTATKTFSSAACTTILSITTTATAPSPMLLRRPDWPDGPLWSVGGAWVDLNNDGLLDLVIVNYLRWDVST